MPDDASPRDDFLAFVRAQFPSARGAITPPATPRGWETRLDAVREGLARSFGRRPDEPCELSPEVLGTLKRDGYAIDRLTFQSRPGVRVTANLYRPDPIAPGARLPAVLNVHGHWSWARIDPHVQARCIGLARLGYLALCVDAFGAGERAVEPAPGTYHGGLLGAMLWPPGVPLLGLQVYDNRRAVDYLLSRSDVDPSKLAVTGASGGGNQTLYAGATDDRFAAVVPVCGVGTYESYVGPACCVCEVLVGGLTYATTGDTLALVAPRALMVINATRDAVQFSVGEAAKSVAYARERFRGLGVEGKIKHVAIESGHDYNKEMREAMYGWLDRWLLGKGDGSPAPEPDIKTEDPADLRCYPDGPSRPKAVVTIPVFAMAEGRARLRSLAPAPDHAQRWEADADRLRADLRDHVLGGFPKRSPTKVEIRGEIQLPTFEMQPEPGLTLRAYVQPASDEKHPGTTLVLQPGEADIATPEIRALREAGLGVAAVDLRATGRLKPATSAVAGASDHHEAEWSLWIGRPLLGQWAWDVIRWLDAFDEMQRSSRKSLAPPPYRVVGVGPFALVALVAAALDDRIAAVGLLGGPSSLLGAGPASKLPMGLLAPNLFDVGDVAHLAALVAPRPLSVAGGTTPDGQPADEGRLREGFAFARTVYGALESADRLRISPSADVPTLLAGWGA